MALPRGPNHIPSLHLSAGHGNPRFNSDENRSSRTAHSSPATDAFMSTSRCPYRRETTLPCSGERKPSGRCFGGFCSAASRRMPWERRLRWASKNHATPPLGPFRRRETGRALPVAGGSKLRGHSGHSNSRAMSGTLSCAPSLRALRARPEAGRTTCLAVDALRKNKHQHRWDELTRVECSVNHEWLRHLGLREC
jgi:hypothetical protein